jgi:hypothetical protein
MKYDIGMEGFEYFLNFSLACTHTTWSDFIFDLLNLTLRYMHSMLATHLLSEGTDVHTDPLGQLLHLLCYHRI